MARAQQGMHEHALDLPNCSRQIWNVGAKQLSSMKCDASKSFDRSQSYEELPLQRVLAINGKAL
jgi:hypothetical protein